MIKFVTGRLLEVCEESVIIEVGPFQVEVLVPDFVRRNLQSMSGEDVGLHTVFYMDGNPQGKMTPRMVGFLSKTELEFFELFCSVDGVGVKKALRAMVRPVGEVATAIEEQNATALSKLPGVGAATAERIIAKLRRKMPKFALLVAKDSPPGAMAGSDVLSETADVLRSLGHSEGDARRLVDGLRDNGRKIKDVQAALELIYRQTHAKK